MSHRFTMYDIFAQSIERNDATHRQLPRCNRVARTSALSSPSMIKPDLRPILWKTLQSDHTSNAFAIWFIHRFSQHANLKLWNEWRIHLSLMDQIDPRAAGISCGKTRMIDRVSESCIKTRLYPSNIRLRFWRANFNENVTLVPISWHQCVQCL